ncbi:MAG TPA: VTT domain-containing protein, partial [Gammaproteobacteria bacterium]|nr:VTT domain-containing protein [Gammaproteobacteria bacterium]
YPRLPEAGDDMAINVHAKILVADDRLLRIGSSNLNNRSMGLDSECDLSLEADDDNSMTAVRDFRNRLLAEHLDVQEAQVTRRCQEQPSLIAAIEALQGKPRSLMRLEPTIPEEVEQNLPGKALIDPEAPVDSDRLRELLVPDKARRPAASRVALQLLMLAAILAMAAAWRWTPLGEWASVHDLSAAIRDIQGNLLAPLAAVAIVTLGGLLAVPITLLFVSSMLVFGTAFGALYSLVGAMLSAVLAYLAGQRLGRDTLRRLAGPRLNHISKQLAQRGILTVVIVRMIPAAPFVAVNLVAGISHIRLRDFIIGSAIGMLPGTLALALITEGVLRAADKPSAYHWLLVALALLALGAAGLLLRHWLLRTKPNSGVGPT